MNKTAPEFVIVAMRRFLLILVVMLGGLAQYCSANEQYCNQDACNTITHTESNTEILNAERKAAQATFDYTSNPSIHYQTTSKRQCNHTNTLLLKELQKDAKHLLRRLTQNIRLAYESHKTVFRTGDDSKLRRTNFILRHIVI